MAKSNFNWRRTMLGPLLKCDTAFSPNIILLHPTRFEEHPGKDLIPFAHYGFDKEGRPIYWEKTGVISSNFVEMSKVFSVEELVFFHIQSQEMFELRYKFASERFNRSVHQSVVVFDLKNLNYTLDLGAIAYMKSMLGIDQNNYPERLSKLFIINTPWFFTIIFAMFKPFIDKKTQEKFVLLGADYMSTLEQFIDKSQIPAEVRTIIHVFVYLMMFST